MAEASGPVPTERIRNVVVLGHTGTGKSTLVEAMLAMAGHGAHGKGCPTVDHEPEERERGHSLSLALVSFEFEGYKLNILDAPGGAEVLGDAYPALLAADTALFVIDATVGVQPQHEELWRVCEQRGIPRIVFLNKLDLERADYQGTIDDLRARYGKPLAPVHMPLGHPRGVRRRHRPAAHGGGRGPRRPAVHEPIPDERRPQAEANREGLIEAVVENDDDLLERYLDGEVPSIEEVAELFAHGIAEAGSSPCSAARPSRTSASTCCCTSSSRSARRPPRPRIRCRTTDRPWPTWPRPSPTSTWDASTCCGSSPASSTDDQLIVGRTGPPSGCTSCSASGAVDSCR
jgi:elongation factor G